MKLKVKKSIWGVIVGVVLALAIPVVFYLFTLENLWYEAYAAIIGVILTAIVTVLLLDGQSRSEEEKDKNIEVYKMRLGTYSEFNQKMWEILNDDEICPKEVLELQGFVFKEVILHLSAEEIAKLTEVLEEMKKEKNLSGKGHLYFGEISVMLQESLLNKKSRGASVTPTQITNLRSAFKNLIGKLSNDVEPIVTAESSESEVELPVAATASALKGQNWHFIAYNDTQFEQLEKGNDVLSLIEYGGEDWRTQTLRQIKEDDHVFLFRRGGYGYVGVYRAKGYVVYTQDDGGVTKLTCMFGSEPKEERFTYDAVQALPDTAKYDIYNALADDATSVASLIVEPVFYEAEGVGTVTVYRKTISRFDPGYAAEIYERFQ